MRRALAALLILSCLAGVAPAQESRQPLRSPILTLDQERLFTESKTGRAVLQRLEADSADLAAENRKIEAQLVAEERALTEERSKLAAEEFRAKAEAFDDKVVSIRRAQDAKARTLAQRRDADQQAFYREALPLLAELVRERGAVAVLERGTVILSAEQVDITDAAIALIDARIGPEAEVSDEAERPETPPDAPQGDIVPAPAPTPSPTPGAPATGAGGD